MPKGVPNKQYTPEFKKMVIETMMEEKLSYRETVRRFDVSSDTRIKDWPKKLPKEVEEDLLAEVQRLRAENDYLKNLQALVLEDERRQRRKHR